MNFLPFFKKQAAKAVREFNLNDFSTSLDEVYGSDDTVAGIARMWQQYEPELRVFIAARKNFLEQELIHEVPSEEVDLYRHRISECLSIFEEMRKIAGEYENRKLQGLYAHEDNEDEEAVETVETDTG